MQRTTILLVAAVTLGGFCIPRPVCAIFAEPTLSNGIFTADVEVTVNGETLPAVINPDYPGIGLATGSTYSINPLTPSNFNFSVMTVFSYVPAMPTITVPPMPTVPWPYPQPLFDAGMGTDLDTRNFSLTPIGLISLDSVNATAQAGVFDVYGRYESLPVVGPPHPPVQVQGTLELAPPMVQPGFVLWGVNNLNLSGFDNTMAPVTVSVASNNGGWAATGNGWPGAVFDKVFFPLPPTGTAEFNPVLPPSNPPVPPVTPPATPNDPPFGTVWDFVGVTVTQTSQRWWLDPAIAVGYDYLLTTAPTDGHFASVILPTTPGTDKLYDIVVYNPTTGTWIVIRDDVLAGTEVFFSDYVAFAVNRFRILGINPPLDDQDPTLFPTGMTFTQVGDYDVKMTALIPEPTTLACGVVLTLGLWFRRPRRA